MLHSISNFEEEKAEARLKKKEKQERIAKKKSIAEENKLRDQNYYEHPGTELLIPNHWKTTKATETTCFLVVPLVLD